MRAVGTRIPNRQNDVSRQLMLDIQVVLLNHALLEIEILRNDGARECVIGGGARMGVRADVRNTR